MLKVFKTVLHITSKPEEEVDSIFKKLDNDNNGYIEYEEFVRASINKEIFVNSVGVIDFIIFPSLNI